MSNTVCLGPNVLAFVPETEEEPHVSNPIDTEAIAQEIRTELEAEYAHRIEREVATRLQRERQRFEESLRNCSAGFDQCIKTLRKEIQSNVVDLSIQLAEVIVRHQLPDREMLRNLMVKTLEPVSDLQGATVRISSSDWELFGKEVYAGDHLGVGSTVQFAEDPNLEAGDVIVESRNGIFDARLSERLKMLKESLYERSGRKSAEPAEL